MLQTVQKVGPVLDLFTAERPEWGVTEVATALQIPRSSAHALLSSLAETGLLSLRERGRYRVGWRVLELNAVLDASLDLRAVAAPVLAETAERVGETLQLGVLERDKVLYIEKVVATKAVTVNGARIGWRLDAHCSGVGKILLAFADPSVVERICASPLRRLSPATITEPAELRRELTAVRAAGVAYDRGEIVSDIHCVAAPMRDAQGNVVAAVSITAPANRFAARVDELRAAVLAAAAAMSRTMKAPSASGAARPAG